MPGCFVRLHDGIWLRYGMDQSRIRYMLINNQKTGGHTVPIPKKDSALQLKSAKDLVYETLCDWIMRGEMIDVYKRQAVRIEQDIRGANQGFHLGFPLVRIRAETLLGNGKAILRIPGHPQLQMAPCLLYTSRCV